MNDELFSTEQFENMLRNFDPDQPESLNDLIQYSKNRLRLLAHRLFANESQLSRWEQTDDVVQNAMMDLCNTLRREKPTTKNSFFALAFTIIRHKILDMARSLRRENADALYHHHTTGAAIDSDVPRLWEGETPATADRSILLQEAVESLPDREKTVIELCYFGEMTSEIAAETLGVSVRTLREIKRSARLKIRNYMNDLK